MAIDGLYMGIWPGSVVMLCMKFCVLTAMTECTSYEAAVDKLQVLWASHCLASCCSVLEVQQSLQGGGMRLVWPPCCA